MIKVGISTATFFSRLVNEDAISLLEKWEIPVCEVFLNTYMEYEEDFINLLLSRKKKIEVNSVHSLTNQFEPQLFNIAERTREDALRFYKKMLKAANMLGAKYYTFHGPAIFKVNQKVPQAEALSNTVNHLIDVADAYNVELSYENVHWAYYNSVGFFSKLSALAPRLRGTLDIKQAMQSGIDYKLFLNEMGEKLSTVHICDYDANGRLTIPSKGIFNYNELISRLMDINYKGCILLELYSKDYGELDEVYAAYEYIRECVYRAEQNRKI